MKKWWIDHKFDTGERHVRCFNTIEELLHATERMYREIEAQQLNLTIKIYYK